MVISALLWPCCLISHLSPLLRSRAAPTAAVRPWGTQELQYTHRVRGHGGPRLPPPPPAPALTWRRRMTQGLQALLSTHWVPALCRALSPGGGFPCPSGWGAAVPRRDERSLPTSPCCRLPLWHWLLHRPRSIPRSLCQQQSCSKPSLIKETHSPVLPPQGGLEDALMDGAGGLRGRPTPPEGDRH